MKRLLFWVLLISLYIPVSIAGTVDFTTYTEQDTCGSITVDSASQTTFTNTAQNCSDALYSAGLSYTSTFHTYGQFNISAANTGSKLIITSQRTAASILLTATGWGGYGLVVEETGSSTFKVYMFEKQTGTTNFTYSTAVTGLSMSTNYYFSEERTASGLIFHIYSDYVGGTDVSGSPVTITTRAYDSGTPYTIARFYSPASYRDGTGSTAVTGVFNNFYENTGAMPSTTWVSPAGAAYVEVISNTEAKVIFGTGARSTPTPAKVRVWYAAEASSPVDGTCVADVNTGTASYVDITTDPLNVEYGVVTGLTNALSTQYCFEARLVDATTADDGNTNEAGNDITAPTWGATAGAASVPTVSWDSAVIRTGAGTRADNVAVTKLRMYVKKVTSCSDTVATTDPYTEWIYDAATSGAQDLYINELEPSSVYKAEVHLADAAGNIDTNTTEVCISTTAKPDVTTGYDVAFDKPLDMDLLSRPWQYDTYYTLTKDGANIDSTAKTPMGAPTETITLTPYTTTGANLTLLATYYVKLSYIDINGKESPLGSAQSITLTGTENSFDVSVSGSGYADRRFMVYVSTDATNYYFWEVIQYNSTSLGLQRLVHNAPYNGSGATYGFLPQTSDKTGMLESCIAGLASKTGIVDFKFRLNTASATMGFKVRDQSIQDIMKTVVKAEFSSGTDLDIYEIIKDTTYANPTTVSDTDVGRYDDGEWHDVRIEFTGTSYKFYVDDFTTAKHTVTLQTQDKWNRTGKICVYVNQGDLDISKFVFRAYNSADRFKDYVESIVGIYMLHHGISGGVADTPPSSATVTAIFPELLATNELDFLETWGYNGVTVQDFLNWASDPSTYALPPHPAIIVNHDGKAHVGWMEEGHPERIARGYPTVHHDDVYRRGAGNPLDNIRRFDEDAIQKTGVDIAMDMDTSLINACAERHRDLAGTIQEFYRQQFLMGDEIRDFYNYPKYPKGGNGNCFGFHWGQLDSILAIEDFQYFQFPGSVPINPYGWSPIGTIGGDTGLLAQIVQSLQPNLLPDGYRHDTFSLAPYLQVLDADEVNHLDYHYKNIRLGIEYTGRFDGSGDPADVGWTSATSGTGTAYSQVPYGHSLLQISDGTSTATELFSKAFTSSGNGMCVQASAIIETGAVGTYEGSTPTPFIEITWADGASQRTAYLSMGSNKLNIYETNGTTSTLIAQRDPDLNDQYHKLMICGDGTALRFYRENVFMREYTMTTTSSYSEGVRFGISPMSSATAFRVHWNEVLYTDGAKKRYPYGQFVTPILSGKIETAKYLQWNPFDNGRGKTHARVQVCTSELVESCGSWLPSTNRSLLDGGESGYVAIDNGFYPQYSNSNPVNTQGSYALKLEGGEAGSYVYKVISSNDMSAAELVTLDAQSTVQGCSNYEIGFGESSTVGDAHFFDICTPKEGEWEENYLQVDAPETFGYGFDGIWPLDEAVDGWAYNIGDTVNYVVLTAALTAVATSMTVDDTTNFPSSGGVFAGREYITYTGKTSTTLTGLTRGVNGTIADSHSSGSEVYSMETTYIETGSVLQRAGKFGMAADFDGSGGDYLDAAFDPCGGSAYCFIGGWLDWDESTAVTDTLYESSAMKLEFLTSTGYAQCSATTASGTATVQSTTAFNDGATVTHRDVKCEYDKSQSAGNRLCILVNNTSEACAATDYNENLVASSAQRLGDGLTPGPAYNGTIDDWVQSATAVTAETKAYLYNSGTGRNIRKHRARMDWDAITHIFIRSKVDNIGNTLWLDNIAKDAFFTNPTSSDFSVIGSNVNNVRFQFVVTSPDRDVGAGMRDKFHLLMKSKGLTAAPIGGGFNDHFNN